VSIEEKTRGSRGRSLSPRDFASSDHGVFWRKIVTLIVAIVA